MNDAKYIGMDVHTATISAAVRDSSGNLVMEATLETKAETILEFVHGLRGSLRVSFEEGTCAAWLRKRRQKVKLQEQPLQVLVALLERPGELVTREELRSKLWPADTFVDFDHGLNAAVKRLRDVLGESADAG